MVKTFRFIGR